MDRLKEYLHKYINNPHDPYINAELGEEYEKIGQGAASLSYFLRAAELLHTYDPEMAYCCVLKTWKQLHNTKRRPDYEREQLQTAVAYLPTRPEAYYHLSKIHSSREEWKTSYMYSCLGLQYTNSPPLEYDVGYPGDYMLIFQKAFTSWYIGQREESKSLWLQLSKMKNIPQEYMKIIRENSNAYKSNKESKKIVKFDMWENQIQTKKEYYIIK